MNDAALLVTSASGRSPRMSVMMPNYNHGHFIEEALTAISQQTMMPFEVVVVDDGSTDDSVARLQSLAPKMPWLRIHRHSENRGVVAAMNTGFALVRGDFVLGTAADDRLDREIIERAFTAAAEFPSAGIVFSDQAEMSADGSGARTIRLDLPSARRHFSASEFVRLMQREFFYFHVSSVWFNTELLRSLGGFRPELRWHADLFAAYAAAFERGATYVPGAVSYFRRLPHSYSAGARGDAQNEVLLAWLAATREAGWEARRASFVAAAIWPEYSLRAVRALRSDPGYVTLRLAVRLVWFAAWTRIAPFAGHRARRWMRGLRSRWRRARLVR
jgi:glycosyltransferase involved in cell wall biosynthesis